MRVVHMACDFNSEMGAVDRGLLDGLLPALAAQPRKPRLIYHRRLLAVRR